MTIDSDAYARRRAYLDARGVTYCGECLRGDVPTTVYATAADGTEFRACATCQAGWDRRRAARAVADALVLEFLRTRRAIVREHDAFELALEDGTDSGLDGLSEVTQAGFKAERALVAFLGNTEAASAVIDVLDHHFATDHSEIHGYGQTLTFTAELDRVLASGGKDAFERHLDANPA